MASVTLTSRDHAVSNSSPARDHCPRQVMMAGDMARPRPGAVTVVCQYSVFTPLAGPASA